MNPAPPVTATLTPTPPVPLFASRLGDPVDVGGKSIEGPHEGRPDRRTPDDRAMIEPAPSPPEGVSLLYVATISHTIRRFLLPYAAHFRALGWRVAAAASGASADPVLREAFDAVHEIPLSRSLLDVGGLIRGERAIAKVAAEQDIVHVHTPIASFVTRLATSRRADPERPAVAYTAHGFHFHEGGRAATNAVFRTAERLAGRWTDRLVVINEEDFLSAQRHRIVGPGRLVRMPGIGIDTGRFSRSSLGEDEAARIRRDLGIAADVPLFVVAAEYNRNKRVGDIIRALAAMRHREAELLLIGGGPGQAGLAALTERVGVDRRTRIEGFVDDLRPIVSAATALVLPSKREGLARSIMEALSLEVPVIASTARGNAELVGVDSGLIVGTGDVAGFAAAMDWMIDHPRERHAMGVRGRARMVEGYDLEIVIQRHEELYRQMLAERRRTSAGQGG
jgi:glycosyltransferase involved in cell wall biosynthesis